MPMLLADPVDGLARPLLVATRAGSPAGRAIRSAGTIHGWSLTFTLSVTEILPLLESGSHAAVLCAIDGGPEDVALLEEIRRRAPGVPRILCISPEQVDAGLAASPLADQVVRLPATGAALEMVLDRATGGVGRVSDERLFRAMPVDVRLPALSGSVVSLLAALDDPKKSIAQVVQILENEPALAATTLRLANSETFELSRRVSTLKQAVTLLGMNALRAIAMAGLCFASIPGCREAHVEAVRQRGMVSARLVRRIAGSRAGDVLTAAILQDIGQLVLAASLGDEYTRLVNDAHASGVPLAVLEEQRLGASHAAVGAALLDQWGLPKRIVQAVALGHTAYPHPSRGLDHVAVLYIVSALMDEMETGELADAALPAPWLARAGVEPARLEDWRRVVTASSIAWPGAVAL